MKKFKVVFTGVMGKIRMLRILCLECVVLLPQMLMATVNASWGKSAGLTPSTYPGETSQSSQILNKNPTTKEYTIVDDKYTLYLDAGQTAYLQISWTGSVKLGIRCYVLAGSMTPSVTGLYNYKDTYPHFVLSPDSSGKITISCSMSSGQYKYDVSPAATMQSHANSVTMSSNKGVLICLEVSGQNNNYCPYTIKCSTGDSTPSGYYKTYGVSYVLDGGTAGKYHQTTATNDVSFRVSSPTKSGYLFKGWSVTSGLDSTTAKYGADAPTTPNSLSSSSKLCGSWENDSTYFKNLTSAGGSVTLTANWKKPTYSVYYALQGGAHGSSHPTTPEIGTTFELSSPRNSGHKFLGWQVSDGLNASTAKWGTSKTALTSLTSSKTYMGADSSSIYLLNLGSHDTTVTIQACWQETDDYDLSYALNGGSYGGSYPASATYGKAFRLYAPEKAGCEFSGWTVSGDLRTGVAKWGTTDSPTTAVSSSSTKCGGGEESIYFMNLTTGGSSVKMSANWTAIPYTITVSSGDGGGGGSELSYTISTSKSSKTFTLPEKENCIIESWVVGGSYIGSAPSVSGSTISIPAGTYGDIELTPVWKSLYTIYSLTYDLNGGVTEGVYQAVATNDVSFNLVSPLRVGYTFVGWEMSSGSNSSARWGNTANPGNIFENKVAACGADVNPVYFLNLSTQDEGTVQLKALWSPNTYELSIDVQDGVSAIKKIVVTYDSLIPDFPVPTWEGHVFCGCFAKADGTGIQYYSSTGEGLVRWSVAAGNKIFAKWEVRQCVTTLNPGKDGSGSVYSFSNDYGSKITVRSTYTRTGYTHTGWCVNDPAGLQVYDVPAELVVTEDVTLYPIWRPNSYVLTINPNNGDATLITNVIYDAEMPMVAVPQKVGYSFTGYFTQASGGVPYYSTDGTGCQMWDRTRATTLYAHWTQNIYKVTFDLGDGSDSSWSTNVTYDAILPKVAIPKCEGRSFSGYVLKGDGSGIAYYSASGVGLRVWDIASDTNLVAVWSNVFVIRYRKGKYGVGEETDFEFEEGDYITSGVPFTREGYDQVGWTSVEDGEQEYPVSWGGRPSGDMTLYPVWRPRQYEIILEPGDGMSHVDIMVTYDADMPTVGVPQKVGHSFEGYFTKSEGGVQYYSADGKGCRTWDQTSASTLYAHWKANEYVVTFELNDGSGATWSTNMTYAAALPQIPVPTCLGYSFAGYFSGANGKGVCYYDATGKALKIWNVADNGKVHAHWVANTYAVTFDAGDGEGGTVFTNATFDAALPKIAIPTLEGYTFGGYFAEMDGAGKQYYDETGAGLCTWDIAEDSTLHAKWEGRGPLPDLCFSLKDAGWPQPVFLSDSKSNTNAVSCFVQGSAIYLFNAFSNVGLKYTSGGFDVLHEVYDEQNTLVNKFCYRRPSSLGAGCFSALWSGSRHAVLQALKVGRYIYRCTIDSENVEEEVSEENNVFSCAFEVIPRVYQVSYRQSASTDDEGWCSVKTNGVIMTLADALFSRVGYTQTGWACSENSETNDFALSGIYWQNAEITLYPVWTPKTYSVTFDAGDGEGGTASTNVVFDAALPKIEIPTLEGYTFGGYFADADGEGMQYYDETGTGLCVWDIAADAVLHAKWTEVVIEQCDLAMYRPTGWPHPAFATSNSYYSTAHTFTTNDAFVVWYSVVNRGSLAVSNLAVRASVAVGNVTRTYGITHRFSGTGLGQNQYFSQNFSWGILKQLPCGNYSVVVTVDPDRKLNDSDRSNNSYTFHFSVVDGSLLLKDEIGCRADDLSVSGAVFVQTNVMDSSSSAIQFGPSDANVTNELRLTLMGPGTISYRWAGNSQSSTWRASYLDGVSKNLVMGMSANWYGKSMTIPSGRHEIRWAASATSPSANGLFVVILDNVVWSPTEVKLATDVTGGKEFGVTSEWVVKDLELRFGSGKGKVFTDKFGDNLSEALTKETGKRDGAGNPMLVWQDYVAGTDPTNPDDRFTASVTIDVETGKPIISWTPELTEAESAQRVYTTYGKAKLSDERWSVVEEGHESDFNFFKVTVEMK